MPEGVPDESALRDAEQAVLDALASLPPRALRRRGWVDGLLTDGYGVAMLLEAASRRLEREIDELLDDHGPDVDAGVARRVRARRDLDRRAQRLRARLDAVRQQAHADS